MDKSNNKIRPISVNKKAKHEFFIENNYEAGIVLLGTEVKSLRMGKCNLRDSYCKISNGEIFVFQVQIQKYPFAYYDNHDPRRPKKLLMHKYEIKRLYGKINERGYTLIPTKIYFYGSKVKINLGLAKGKRQYDKRETIRQRDQQIALARELKNYR